MINTIWSKHRIFFRFPSQLKATSPSRTKALSLVRTRKELLGFIELLVAWFWLYELSDAMSFDLSVLHEYGGSSTLSCTGYFLSNKTKETHPTTGLDFSTLICLPSPNSTHPSYPLPITLYKLLVGNRGPASFFCLQTFAFH